MFPFSGGLYDQEKTNAFTWWIWNFVIATYKTELMDRRSKQEPQTIGS